MLSPLGPALNKIFNTGNCCSDPRAVKQEAISSIARIGSSNILSNYFDESQSIDCLFGVAA
jgi:hypothetical protein